MDELDALFSQGSLPTKPPGFKCSTCGKFHNELPMRFSAEAPALYFSIPEAEREARCDLTAGVCIVDDKHFFVCGSLEIPVIDGSQPFVWGIWVSLSLENFKRTAELWDTPGRENEPPYFGWFSSALPLYPPTLNLKANVQTRRVGQFPLVELGPTDHPLAIEQREGITMDRVRQIAEGLLHPAG